MKIWTQQQICALSQRKSAYLEKSDENGKVGRGRSSLALLPSICHTFSTSPPPSSNTKHPISLSSTKNGGEGGKVNFEALPTISEHSHQSTIYVHISQVDLHHYLFKTMTKTIPTYRRREHLQLPTDEYGDNLLMTTNAEDDNNYNENYGLLQMRDEFVASLMDDDSNNNNNNYQPYPQQHTKHHHHRYNTEFVAPQNGEEMLMHNNNSIPLLDVSALLHQVSTTLVPSLAPSTNSSMLLLPPSTSLTSTASRDNIKTIKMIAYCYILPAVCVLGIIGNLMNVITLASPRLRAVSYMYLRALAIADLLCMCFVLVFASFEVLKEVVGLPIDRHPMFGFYQAHIMLSFINWTLSTGVLIVVALSLERYVSVVFPLHFRVWNSPQRALKAIIVAYLVPAVFYIPYGIGRYSVNRSEAPNGEVFYYPDDSAVSKTVGWQIYKWTREGLLRFLPIVILFVLNSQIMVAFRRRQKMFNRLRNRDQTTIARDDTLLYILGGIAVMFFVCNIPAAINLLFINETVKKRLDYQIFRAMANLLEITNHSAQFYIFCVCSSDYRITFMQKFPCLRAYYISPKFYSFIRNVPKRSGDGISGGGAGGPGVRPMLRRAKSEWTTTKYDEEGTGGRSTEGMLCMRSTTVTAELASTCEGKVAEQETVDSRVQLASEESFSDESDTLLNNNSSKMAEMGWRIDRVTTGRAVLLTEGSAERHGSSKTTAAANTNDTYFL